MIDVPLSDLISKDLRRWFKEKWVDVSRKDKDGKHPPCGRSEAKTDSRGYPKCRPSKKVSEDTPKTSRSMSPKDKKAATRRKRSKPQGVGGKPTVVKSIFDNISPEQARAIAFSTSSPFDYMEQQGDDEATLTVDMGNDPCCNEAREMWREGLIEGWGEEFSNDPDGGLPILEYYDAMSCDEFQQSLEGRFDAQGYALLSGGGSNQRAKTRLGMNPSSPRSNYAWEDHLAQRVLQAWDKCSESRQEANDMLYASSDPFEVAWDLISKGRFHGYTQSNISNRPYRQAEHRVWDISRKVKRERTKKRYARNKSRGTVRPSMRRQLGAGGKRASTKR
jgi:hypothetical protein